MTDLRSDPRGDNDLDDPSVVVLRGDIDMSSASAIGVTVESRRRAGWSDLTLDMRDVSFMDSQGLNELIKAHRTLVNDGGRLRLRSPSPPVELALRIAGVDAIIPIEL